MDPCVNKIVNDIYFSKSTALVESNPTNSARSNLAKPLAIEEPSQRAEAKGTNTECEYGVNGQVFFTVTNPFSSSCKVKES